MFVFSGTSEELCSFGSVDYWLRLRVPMTETIRLYKEKAKAVDYIHSALNQDAQVAHLKEFCHAAPSVLPDLITLYSPVAFA